MKIKVLSWLITAFFFAFSTLSAQEMSKPPSKTIVATLYPLYIALINLTKGIPNYQVLHLADTPTGCLHDYQLTTSDLKKIMRADIVVINGAGTENLEVNLKKLVSQYPQIIVINASEGLELIKEQNEFNPHIWVSITGAMAQVKVLENKLREFDPSKADLFKKNADEYLAKLEVLKGKSADLLKSINHRDIVTFHKAFSYFAKELNLNVAAVIELEPGKEPSAKELLNLIKAIRSKKIQSIFTEPQYSAKVAELIARETGVKIYILDPIVTGPLNENAYIEIMERNLDVLKTSLK